MAESRESISNQLTLISAKAKQLQYDFDNNKLWEGNLDRGLIELRPLINKMKIGKYR